MTLDKLPFYKTAGLVEARGAKRLFMLPYSPDFNPIELAFSKLKDWLRTTVARTRLTLAKVLTQVLNWMSAADVKNWLDHCSYYLHLLKIHNTILQLV